MWAGGGRAAERVAAATPGARERYVDLLRAVAILIVVVGHWLAVTLTVRDGRLIGGHVLAAAPWTHWLTWVVQVMALFFVVGGYANAASWDAHRDRGGRYTAWLLHRAGRLLRPTTAFVAVGVAAAAAARLAGADPGLVATAAWLAPIALWFLAVYLAVIVAAPALLGLHRRHGLAVIAAATVAVVLVDVLRLGYGVPLVGLLNWALVWGVLHQLGYAWRDGTLTRRPLPAVLGGGGLAVLVALVTVGPYPVSMVGVPGATLQNSGPPSLALLALSFAQTGVALLLRRPLTGWLQRPRVWLVVVAVNRVAMRLYLWHMVPVVIAALALYTTGLLPRAPAGSAAWFALRPLWVAGLAALLALIVALVARFERPPGATPPIAGRGSAALAVAGCAAVCTGIAAFSLGGGFQGGGPAGLPLTGLSAYVGGLVLLRLAGGGFSGGRSHAGSRGAGDEEAGWSAAST